MTNPEGKNPSRPIRRYRLLVVGVTLIAALSVWLVAELGGIQLNVTSPLAGTITIGLVLVIAGALPAALAGWAALALLERFSSSPRRVWTILAVAVLVASLPPLAALDATTSTKVVLALMHLATGLPLIFLFPRGAEARPTSSLELAGRVD